MSGPRVLALGVGGGIIVTALLVGFQDTDLGSPIPSALAGPLLLGGLIAALSAHWRWTTRHPPVWKNLDAHPVADFVTGAFPVVMLGPLVIGLLVLFIGGIAGLLLFGFRYLTG
jgi:hypothetical protein